MCKLRFIVVVILACLSSSSNLSSASNLIINNTNSQIVESTEIDDCSTPEQSDQSRWPVDQNIKFIGEGLRHERFEMILKRDGGNHLEGSYVSVKHFYANSKGKNRIKLSGRMDTEDCFTLQEFNKTGKLIGEIRGAWSDGPNNPRIMLEGEWNKIKSDETYYDFRASEAPVLPKLKFRARKISEVSKSKEYSISAEYPEIVGANKFNQQIKTFIKKEFFAELRNAEPYIEPYEAKEASPSTEYDSFFIDFRIEYGTKDLVSVSFVEDNIIGPPGYTSYSSFNYDLATNKKLELADLFEPNSNYLEVISRHCIAELQKGWGSGYNAVEFEASAKLENYKNWNLTPKGLMITAQGQLGLGYKTPQIIVPYSKLVAIAKRDGLLSKLLN